MAIIVLKTRQRTITLVLTGKGNAVINWDGDPKTYPLKERLTDETVIPPIVYTFPKILQKNQHYTIRVEGATIHELGCGENAITELKVEKGDAVMKVLSCYNNNLTSLDVSALRGLERLLCPNNAISTLTITGCTALKELSCHDNKLTVLRVGKTEAKTGTMALSAASNTRSVSTSSVGRVIEKPGAAGAVQGVPRPGLVVPKPEPVPGPDCGPAGHDLKGSDDRRPLPPLDVKPPKVGEIPSFPHDPDVTFSDGGEYLPNLEYLYCNSNQLTELNVLGCTKLVKINCDHNKLGKLDLSGLAKLTYVACHNNGMTTLDVSGCKALRTINCLAGQKTEMSVTGLTEINSPVTLTNKPENEKTAIKPIPIKGAAITRR